MKPTFLVARVNNCDYRADRQTPLGNPFKMYNEDQRDSVCQQFFSYFEDKMFTNDPLIISELIKIKELSKDKEYFRLGCHCFPKRCHLDTVTYFLNNFYNSI